MKFYQPEKYKVIEGRGENIALCTVWSDPELIIKRYPELLDKVAVLSSLYSKEGVNIMLRNLCLNPQIRYLLVWGNNNLSKTPIGRSGISVLEKAFSDGVSESGEIDGFKLHDNMDFSAVRKCIENVEFIDVSDQDISGLLGQISKCTTKDAYMEPKTFPVYERSIETFPSEEVGWLVRGKNIADTWVSGLDRIIRYGTIKPTEYGNNMKELLSLTRIITSEDTKSPSIPNFPKAIKDITGLKDKEDIDEYVNSIFLEKKLPEGTAYTYGQRLGAYKIDGKCIDQIEFIINKIKECDTSRRAVAVLWNPIEDQPKSSPPCFTYFQALQNLGKLHAFALFRSQDMFKAALLNEFGLRRIQENIAKELSLAVGSLTVTTNSAHVYEEDWDKARDVCHSELWAKPVVLAFNEEDIDPRGYIVVNVVGEKIVVDLVSPKEGNSMMTLDGVSAKELCLKISDLGILSMQNHYMDIARQLQRAEIARDLGIEFKQDKKLNLDKFKK